MLHSVMLCILCTRYSNGQCKLYCCVINVVYLFNVLSYVILFPTHCNFIINFTRILFEYCFFQYVAMCKNLLLLLLFFLWIVTCHMYGNIYMSSHVQKCDFVSNFEILYIYVCFVYMLRAPRQMSYRSPGLPS